MHAKGGGIVDHDRAGLRARIGKFARAGRARAEERVIEAGKSLRAQLLDRQLPAVEFDRFPRRARGSHRHQVRHGKLAALERAQDFMSNRARRAHHGDAIGFHERASMPSGANEAIREVAAARGAAESPPLKIVILSLSKDQFSL